MPLDHVLALVEVRLLLTSDRVLAELERSIADPFDLERLNSGLAEAAFVGDRAEGRDGSPTFRRWRGRPEQHSILRETGRSSIPVPADSECVLVGVTGPLDRLEGLA